MVKSDKETVTMLKAPDTSGCAITGTPKMSTAGQKVTFKITTGGPLAYEQHIVWEDVTTAGAVNF